MTDLTEKIKELLMGCECTDYVITFFAPFGNKFKMGDSIAHQLAKQLAPEIEKMLPRWIPVYEGLPDEFETIDLFAGGRILDCTRRNGKWHRFNPYWADDYGNGAWDEITDDVTHWMPVMKGPPK